MATISIKTSTDQPLVAKAIRKPKAGRRGNTMARGMCGSGRGRAVAANCNVARPRKNLSAFTADAGASNNLPYN